MANTKQDNKSKQRILNSFYAKVGATINKYNLINNNDTILVGLSGGKDSLCLLSVLESRLKVSKDKYNLIAAHIYLKNTESDKCKIKDKLNDFCKKLNIELIIKEINPDFSSEKSNCYICSAARRKKLFEIAIDLKCNKLALGHHLDDCLETFFLNMFYNSEISSIPPKLEILNNKLSIIRPFIELTNNEILTVKDILNLNTIQTECTFEDSKHRKKTAELVDYIEKKFSIPRTNIYKSFGKILTDYLPLQNIK